MSSCGNITLGNYGRLGNQLFQIYAALGYQLKYNIDALFFNDADVLDILNIQYTKPPKANGSKILKDVKSNFYTDFQKYDHSIMRGYFQSWKYHEAIPESFFDTNLNSITKNGYYDEVTSNNSTMIHIRRGDYVRVGNYYEKLTKTY